MDLSDYSRNLWSKLGFTGARGAMTEGAIGWGKFDPDQPLFNGIFEDKNAPQSPLFRFTVELGAGKGDQTVLTLANGKPMIIERIVGKGRALLYAVPVDPREGDFPFSGIFAPLLFRSVCYTSLGNLNQDNAIQTGNGFSPVVQIPTAVTATLTTPDQSKFELPPHPTAGGVEYRVEDVPLAGIYALTANGRTVAKFSANSPVAGSRLTRDEDGKLFAQAHVISQDKQEIAREINSARYGRELWLPIAVLFLLLLIAETLVGRTSRKEAING